MADGKWIEDLTPDTPLVDAARRALLVRLEVVRDALPLALRKADKDVEHVHQLRVATRRAGAALDIFSMCLPDKVYRKTRKHLRTIRRLAGAARDKDVFLLHLADWERQNPKYAAGIDFLLGFALAERMRAQEQLESIGPDYPFHFERWLSDTIAAVQRPQQGPPSRTLISLARPMLTDLLHNLQEAAGRDLENYDLLHQVRIAGKRLRYAMEIFADCFDPLFRTDVYPAVEAMQGILGEANDSHVAGQWLSDIRVRLRGFCPVEWKRLRPGIDALLRFHQRRLPRERRRFLQWWKNWQETGTQQALIDLLQGTQTSAV
jgi:CHAD domain-containing protein